MSAQAVPPGSDRPPVPDWLMPPPGGFTADDLDRLPELPPHTELIDGSLVLVSPQKLFHTKAMDLILQGLQRAAPKDLRVRREMSVIIGRMQRPEPDIVVVRTSAETDDDMTAYQADAVVLAVEVVSPDSVARDRIRKPLLYAQAGIKHFWRVEDDNGLPVVYAHERDPATGDYALTGIHDDRLKLTRPFAIDIDLTDYEHF